MDERIQKTGCFTSLWRWLRLRISERVYSGICRMKVDFQSFRLSLYGQSDFPNYQDGTPIVWQRDNFHCQFPMIRQAGSKLLLRDLKIEEQLLYGIDCLFHPQEFCQIVCIFHEIWRILRVSCAYRDSVLKLYNTLTTNDTYNFFRHQFIILLISPTG